MKNYFAKFYVRLIKIKLGGFEHQSLSLKRGCKKKKYIDAEEKHLL